MTDIIRVEKLGVRFRRNRGSHRNFKDLFGGKNRRLQKGEFWALRDVSFTVRAGERRLTSVVGVVALSSIPVGTAVRLAATPDAVHRFSVSTGERLA